MNLFSTGSVYPFVLLFGLRSLAAVSVVPGAVVSTSKPQPTRIATAQFALEAPPSGRDLFWGKPVELHSAAEFVKFGLEFAAPAPVRQIGIESCQDDFGDGIEFFIHPGGRRAFAEGGRKSVKVKVPGDQPVKTLAIVFGHRSPACLKSLDFYDAEARRLDTVLVEPTAEAPTSSPGASRAFAQASLSEILDRELTTRDEERNWHFRFRSDSTFFIYGFNETEVRRGQINALGRFEILATEDKKIKLRLRGTRLESAGLWDGWLCSRGCMGSEARSARAIDETILMEKWPVGLYMIRNRNSPKSRSLLFSDLKTKISSLAE